VALNIKNPEADRLAHELAKATGESLTEAVIAALRERLAVVQQLRESHALLTDVSDIQAFVASLPDRDTRSADEILAYDEFGLPS
jgi:antitoxin VapB